MKSVTINNKTLELVEVPEGAYDFELPYYDCKNHITYKYGSGTEDFDIFRKTIPSGSYALLFKASEATGDFEFLAEINDEIRSLGMDENKVIILEKITTDGK